MHVRVFPLGPYEANCTLIWRDDGSALAIDPGADGDSVASVLRQSGLALSAVFLTHGHFDHISGVDALLARFPAPVFMHAGDEALAFSRFNLAQPGYGGMARTPLLDLTLGEGDTLFAGGSYGRTDLPGGSWPQLEQSLKRLAALPGETRVICGHGEETTIDAWRGCY